MSLLPVRRAIDLEFDDLAYTVRVGKSKEKKIILKHVSGAFHSGRLTAIMGPSGAGKTTLMNILAGYRLSNVEGSILVNGRKRDVRQFRKMACFIMQEDHHIDHFTVNEAMNFSCNLKLGNTLAQDRKQDMIREILETLSLSDCYKTRTSDLSGGQRKRLSIAVELVNNPPIMFFDEPTSGLDSQNSFQCINLLNRLSQDGRTIICTIHQPSARLFEKFDYLYTLSDGVCIYKGTVDGLLPFLSQMDLECPSFHNPADFLIEIAASEDHILKLSNAVSGCKCNGWTGKEIDSSEINCTTDQQPKRKQHYITNITTGQSVEEASFLFPNRDCGIKINNGSDDLASSDQSIFVTSQCQQFVILVKRNFISIMRDSMLTKLRFMSHVVIGLLFGILYYNIGNEASQVFSNSGFLFCCVFFNIFAGMMPTLLTFPLEMKVFVREHHNCWYSLKAYYLAKTAADIPFQILYPFLYVLIVYFLSNQPLELSRFCMFTAICTLTSFVAQSLALAIGAGMEIQAATFFAPVVSIPILLFSGFFINFKAMPSYLKWLSYASYVRYAYEGMIVAIYGDNRENLDCSEAYCHFKSPKKFLEEMNMTNANYLVDFFALCGFIIFLRIICYFVLRWRIRCER